MDRVLCKNLQILQESASFGNEFKFNSFFFVLDIKKCI